MNNYTQESKHNYLPLLGGFVVSTFITAIIFLSTINYGLSCSLNIQVCSAAVYALWLFCLIRSRGADEYSAREKLAAVVFFCILAVYLTKTVWGSRYLTNDVLAAIGATEMGIHNDTLFHSAISQGILNYGTPSFLVNSADFYNYHFMSHAVMAAISAISDVPVYFAYNYLYPVFMLPLYVFLILNVSYKLRALLHGAKKLTSIDLLLVVCLIVSGIPQPILIESSIWKRSCIISESYLIALVFALIYLSLTIKLYERGSLKTTKGRMFAFLMLNPIFIALCGLSKISVGFFLLMGIMWYFFRMHMKELKYWILNAYYLVVFGCMFFIPSLFYSPFSSNTNFRILNPFHYLRTWVGKSYYAAHIFLLFFFSAFFLYMRLRGEKSLKAAIEGKKHIWGEILFLVCVVCVIPGNLFEVAGGSAAYFLYPQQLMAVILLLSYNIPNELWERFINKKRFADKIAAAAVALCIFYSLFLNAATEYGRFSHVITRRYYNSVSNEPAVGLRERIIDGCSVEQLLRYTFDKSRYTDNALVETVDGINNISKGNKEDYYLFIDKDAAVWSKFSHDLDAAMNFFPALTGIVTIGILYYEDGAMYYGNDAPYLSGWYKTNPNDKKMSLTDAMAKAVADGRRYLLYVHGDTYEVLDVRLIP